jgi:hypothetical protein
LSDEPVGVVIDSVMAESKKMRTGAMPDDDISLLLIEYSG